MDPDPRARIRILQVGPLPQRLQDTLSHLYDVDPLWLAPDRAAHLRGAAPYAGAVTMSRHGADDLVCQAVRGGILSCFGVGVEHIDLVAARRFDVTVTNTPDVLTDCVADLAWGLMLAVARRICQADVFVRSGTWKRSVFSMGTSVNHKRLGIVGLGRIGRAVRQRATGFGMAVRYHGPAAKDDVPGFEPSLVELATWADFLVITTPGGRSTHHMVSTDVLRALGPTGFLINVARGSVVDEKALIEALHENAIAGAGLDVFEHEPDVPEALIRDDRVVLLPHIAASTKETREQMEELVLANLHHYLATRKALTPIA